MRTLEVTIENKSSLRSVKIMVSIITIRLVNISQTTTRGAIAEFHLDIINGIHFKGTCFLPSGSCVNTHRLGTLRRHDVQHHTQSVNNSHPNRIAHDFATELPNLVI